MAACGNCKLLPVQSDPDDDYESSDPEPEDMQVRCQAAEVDRDAESVAREW